MKAMQGHRLFKMLREALVKFQFVPLDDRADANDKCLTMMAKSLFVVNGVTYHSSALRLVKVTEVLRSDYKETRACFEVRKI